MPTPRPFLEPLEPRLSLSATPHPTLLKDIAPGPASSVDPSVAIYEAVTIKHTVFFTADDGIHGIALWKTNGTPRSTVMVKSFYPSSDVRVKLPPSHLTNVHGTLYFTQRGTRLWESNGTTRGTVLIKDFESLPYQSNIYTSFNGRLLFTTVQAPDLQDQTTIWITNGSRKGTLPLAVIPFEYNGQPVEVAVTNSTAFIALPELDGGGLWKTDGTPQGTVRLLAFPSTQYLTGPAELAPLGHTLFFAATGAHGYDVIWKSDGTSAGTVPIKPLFKHTRNSTLTNFVPFNGRMYFWAGDGIHTAQRWVTDGTPDGTVPFTPTSNGRPIVFDAAEFNQFLPVGNTLYFVGTAGTLHGLWKIQASQQNATLVRNLSKVPGIVTNLTNVAGTVYFSSGYPTGTPGQHDIRIWQSDGTPRSTYVIAHFVAHRHDNPYNFTPLRHRLFLMADDGNSGYEPWLI